MSIKIELSKIETKQQDVNYPCIMISNYGMIVLFKQKRVGTVLGYTDKWPEELRKHPIGHFSPSLFMGTFSPYTGDITFNSDPFPNLPANSNSRS